LLQLAAVIGRHAPFPLLQAIAEWADAQLHQGLAHLQGAEFLYQTSLFPERSYTLKHALTHEVAYSSLLPERRRALDAKIVEALEQLSSDYLSEQVEGLAHYSLQGEVWDKAVHYCRQGRHQAHIELSAATGLYRTMDMTFWLTRAEAELAKARC
jgi:hypothetical protein